MADFDNTGRGALFKNDRKVEGDKKPEYTGSLNVDGVEFFLDAWLKTSNAGKKFMSVSVKRKDNQPAAAPTPAAARAPAPAPLLPEDDIPF